MDTTPNTEENIAKKYKKCRYRHRKKWEKLSKVRFPGVDFGLEPLKPEEDTLSMTGSIDSFTSSELITYDVCDENYIRKKIKEWEKMRIDETVKLEKLTELLVHMHHPLKKQENDEKMPLLLHKRKTLIFSLLKTIDKEYNVFQTISNSLLRCLKVESHTSGVMESTAEQNFKWNKYDEIILKTKELQNNRTLEEEIKDCEEKLQQYASYSYKAVCDTKDNMATSTDGSNKKFEKTLKKLGKQSADVILKKILERNQTKIDFIHQRVDCE